MINLETLGRALISAQVAELEPKSRLVLRKVYSDLRQGFGLAIGTWTGEGSIDEIFAVTRFSEDLFLVSVLDDTRPHFFHELELEKTEARVGRYEVATLFTDKKLPPGAKEAWTVKPSMGEIDGSYRIAKSGELEESEFWARYNASIIDPEATRQYVEMVKGWYDDIPQYHGLEKTITYLAEGVRRLPEGPIVVDIPPQE